MNELSIKEEGKGEAVTLKVDNQSAINLAKHPVSHGRSKHIKARFHFLREKVMTKPLKIETFERLRRMTGMADSANMIKEECWKALIQV